MIWGGRWANHLTPRVGGVDRAHGAGRSLTMTTTEDTEVWTRDIGSFQANPLLRVVPKEGKCGRLEVSGGVPIRRALWVT